jgi:hypothetical protein
MSKQLVNNTTGRKADIISIKDGGIWIIYVGETVPTFLSEKEYLLTMSEA